MYDTFEWEHADDVVERLLVDRHARVVGRRQLLAQQRRLQREIETVDLAARRHHVVDRNRFEIEQIGEHRPMLAANVLAAFEHQCAELLLRKRRAGIGGGLDVQELEQRLHEKIDEPHDRLGDLQHRHEREAHERREAVRVRSADDFRRDLGEYEEGERNGDSAETQRDFPFTEQALGEDRRERRGSGVEERVAEQNDAEQSVGFVQQSDRELRAAVAALRAVLQTIAVDRHHRRFGEGKKTGGDDQREQRDC